MSSIAFLDSSVFLHAYLTPRRSLTKKETKMKEIAKAIIKEVEEGLPVATSTVHICEIANIIESRVSLTAALGLVSTLFSRENIDVLVVTSEDYKRAILIARRYQVSLNDAVAYLKMKEEGITKIYTFDSHFKNFGDIVILPGEILP
jgi:predicted nucleic acid-binding protein